MTRLHVPRPASRWALIAAEVVIWSLLALAALLVAAAMGVAAMSAWTDSLKAHTRHFWAEPQLSAGHQRAVDWLKAGEAWLESCPDAVLDAMPAHANNLGAMTDALSDLTDDVNGFYRKEMGR